MAGESKFDTSKALIGTDDATLDDKGRLSFVFKKAQRLGERVVMTLGKHACIVVYPRVIWDQIVEDALSLPVMHPARDHFTRLMMATAVDDINFDQQGRLVVPQDLRDGAGLKKGDKVKIAGCGDRVEIWSQTAWAKAQAFINPQGDKRAAAIEAAYAPIAEHVLATRSNDEREAQAKESRA